MMVGDGCDAEWLEEQLSHERDGVLLLDCRSLSAYRAGHIVGAIHLAVPTLMLRRLKKGNLPMASIINCQEGRERFSRRWKTQTVVIHDESTNSLPSSSCCPSSSSLSSSSSSSLSSSCAHAPSSPLVCLLLQRLKDEGCDVRLLQGGFGAFSQRCPGLCVGSSRESESTILGLRYLHLSPSDDATAVAEDDDDGDPQPTSPDGTSMFPVEVLPNLYLGNARNSADLDILYKNGIKYILNVTPNVPNKFEDSGHQFRYLQIPIDDHWSQNMLGYFPQAIAFIEDARRKKCGVLVHCLAGISRSVTITVAYLMYSLSLSLNDAYDHVKRCKPNISPNFSFMGQLMDYERALRIERDAVQVTPSVSSASALSHTSLGSASLVSSASYRNSISSLSSASSVNSASSISPASLHSSAYFSGGSAYSSGSSAYSSGSYASRPSDSNCDACDNHLLQCACVENAKCFSSPACSSLSSLSSTTTASSSSVSSSAFEYEIPSTQS